jgi:hypothetical protein
VVKEYEKSIVDQIADKLRDLKVDSGSLLATIDRWHVITLFAGLLPLNKSDDLAIKLYDNPIDEKFLIQYIVTKKKIGTLCVSIFHLRV